MKTIRHIRDGGFTIVELVVTLSILVIVITLGVPDLTSFLRASRLSSETDGLIALINLGRVESIRTKANTSICALNNPLTDNACSVNSADWANGWGVISNGTVIRRVVPGSGVTVSSAAPALTFNGTIGGVVAAFSITLCAQGQKRQEISVGMSGSVSKFINSSTVCA